MSVVEVAVLARRRVALALALSLPPSKKKGFRTYGAEAAVMDHQVGGLTALVRFFSPAA